MSSSSKIFRQRAITVVERRTEGLDLLQRLVQLTQAVEGLGNDFVTVLRNRFGDGFDVLDCFFSGLKATLGAIESYRGLRRRFDRRY